MTVQAVLLSLEVGICWWLPWPHPQGDQLLHPTSPSRPWSLIFLSESLPIVTGLPLRGSYRRVPERVTPEEMLALLFSSWALSLVPILPGYTDTCSNSLSTGGGYWAS